MATKKNKVTYTKDKFIKDIAARSDMDVADVKQMYAEFENVLTGYLSEADMETDIVVKMFEGFSMVSTFCPETTKKNNFTGEEMVVASKIKPKAKFTRTYHDRLLAANQ